jgi:hypothetical protein
VPAPVDPFLGLLDPLMQVRTLRPRRMFGCWAYYADERLVWVSAAAREPWQGILVPTERAHQPALQAAVPGLRTHPVLGKWLYLPARHPDFEALADRLARMIAAGDPRIGVLPARAMARGRPARASRRKERHA